MAYRFLLQVPESLADQANIAVARPGDAQVVVVRPSHGLGVDDPYVDLTVASHTLNVIDSLYEWFDELGASRPDIRIVLHSGERVALEAASRSDMVARIRRDQPWVERTIPMIGEHERETFSSGGGSAGLGLAAQQPEGSTAVLERTWHTLPSIQRAERKVEIKAVNHVAINVTDLARAEAFYQDFLSLDIVGRGRNVNGRWEALDNTYSWSEAARRGEPADVTYMRNGPLVLALLRLGLGARLERAALDHISLRVDPATFNALRGVALMRPMEVLGETRGSITVRDPFLVTWEIGVTSLPEFLA
jgi:catechol 2,3-dioxygenase-like lactoylglutathione lyase family enzyme